MSAGEGVAPCPFDCDGTADYEIDNEDFGIVRVFCCKCGACGPYVNLADYRSRVKAKAEAARLWNRRTPIAGEGVGEAEARIAAAIRVIEFGYLHRVDGRPVNPLKNGERCSHGRLAIEDCIGCYDEELMAALSGKRAG